MDANYEGPPGLEPQNHEHTRADTHGLPADTDEASHCASPAVNGNESGTVDEPSNEPQGLQEPETEDIKTVSAGDTIYSSATSFEDLRLSPELLQGLYTEMKFEKPSRIQAKTLPMILQPPYRSLIAQAHNGSGKTTCFTLAMLSRVDPSLNQPQALCLCPTRELVSQNVMILKKMGKFTDIKATSTIAIASFPRNHRITEQVMVGTHGSLKNLYSKRVLKFQSVRVVVFDEADEMLKLDGFGSDSVRLVRDLRRDAQQPVQFLLFSATFNEIIKDYALRVTADNGKEEVNQVFVPREDLSLDVIKQYQVECPTPIDKVVVLEEMIFPQCEKLGQTIIFVRTREIARTLHAALEKAGHRCTSIRGDLDHQLRDRVVNEFRTGITKILIATDVLSRGFDVTQVTLVINYDVPVEKDLSTPAYETYLHRIGRSGRFGRKGAAFNLVSGAKEKQILESISEYFRHEIPEVPYNDEDEFLNVLKEAGLTDG
ncbi:g3385 [Coccomyxa viridis]|uniref:RNA helicase n=1 Tax=Coccomyxa viridis TaxID=1274662 RepID=A0ABP1FSS9_9CHLO